MKKEEIFNIIVHNICEVIPELEGCSIRIEDRLVDLGANSIDRAEIVAYTLEELDLKISRVELAMAKSIDELVEVLYEKLQSK
jgi:polyketide biosynthesis acyl carrier protein